MITLSALYTGDNIWMKYLSAILVGFVIFGYTSCSSLKVTSFDGMVSQVVGDTIFLKSGVFSPTKTIEVPDGAVLKGNKTTIKFSENSVFPIIRIKNNNGGGLSNLTISGNKINNDHTKEELQKYNFQFVLELHNSNRINIQNCAFNNSYGTGIHLSDSKNVNILNSTFSDIGCSTPGGVIYTYDAIFIGGYSKSANIKVAGCKFKNIGKSFPPGNEPWPNDGDGIQIQGAGETAQIDIFNNTFENCAARGIKVQTGDNVKIKNNIFLDCGSAVIFAVARQVNNVLVDHNIIRNCLNAMGSDCSRSDLLTNEITISNNQVDNCYYFYRTGGKSTMKNGKIINNRISNVETMAISGRYIDTEISGNTIDKYALNNHHSLNKGIYISPESDNLIIRNNSFIKSSFSKEEIVNDSKNRITIKNNQTKSN